MTFLVNKKKSSILEPFWFSYVYLFAKKSLRLTRGTCNQFLDHSFLVSAPFSCEWLVNLADLGLMRRLSWVSATIAVTRSAYFLCSLTRLGLWEAHSLWQMLTLVQKRHRRRWHLEWSHRHATKSRNIWINLELERFLGHELLVHIVWETAIRIFATWLRSIERDCLETWLNILLLRFLLCTACHDNVRSVFIHNSCGPVPLLFRCWLVDEYILDPNNFLFEELIFSPKVVILDGFKLKTLFITLFHSLQLLVMYD